ARLGTTVMGYPVTLTVGGRQYVAVTTGAQGGGSPRQVPRTIIPEVKMPTTGNALYVFALPEKGREGGGGRSGRSGRWGRRTRRRGDPRRREDAKEREALAERQRNTM